MPTIINCIYQDLKLVTWKEHLNDQAQVAGNWYSDNCLLANKDKTFKPWWSKAKEKKFKTSVSKDYRGDSKVINLVTNYLSDRQQRVRLSGQHFENYNEGCRPGINFRSHSL